MRRGGFQVANATSTQRCSASISRKALQRSFVSVSPCFLDWLCLSLERTAPSRSLPVIQQGTSSSAALRVTERFTSYSMKHRYLTIRSFFTSIERPKSQSLLTTKHAKPNPSSPISISRRVFLSTQPTGSAKDAQSKATSNDAQDPAAHDKSIGTSQLKEQDKQETLHTGDYPSYVKRLTSSLPPLHRPTREEMLALANGFWERLRIRFKWFTIRGFRKFNTDDMSAFLSWFVFGQAVWIFLGTYVNSSTVETSFLTYTRTTFFSVVFTTFNSLRMQGVYTCVVGWLLTLVRICCAKYQRLSHKRDRVDSGF